MHDKRIDQLAKQLVNYSVSLKKGERILIDLFDVPESIGLALIRAVREIGAYPYIQINNSRISREMALHATAEQYDFLANHALAQMEGMQAYIAIRGSDNIYESSDVPASQMALVQGKMMPVLDHRVKKTKWCVLRWPSPSMAQQAGISTQSFEDFYFRVCLLDYPALVPAMNALKKRMDEAKEVHIKGPGTDLRFSIDGLKSYACAGTHNIPDGEVYTAPVKNSVQGKVTYNAPSIYRGIAFDNVCLEFKDGKIIHATANNTPALNAILDSDEGARYIGEFALGFNREIMNPMRDILFDEKIAGSFHFTPGQAYEGDADNGNRSQVHWDLVCLQRPENGGGEIYFDGKLIRKDGQFIPEDVKALNW